jgi:hypothetical protein
MLKSKPLTNVHIFDNKLKNIFIPKKIYTKNEKEILFARLMISISDEAAFIVQEIAKDIDKTSGKNLHHENNIDASDILANILDDKNFNEHILSILIEQLEDINRLGSCNAGRCSRLLQVWNAAN